MPRFDPVIRTVSARADPTVRTAMTKMAASCFIRIEVPSQIPVTRDLTPARGRSLVRHAVLALYGHERRRQQSNHFLAAADGDDIGLRYRQGALGFDDPATSDDPLAGRGGQKIDLNS